MSQVETLETMRKSLIAQGRDNVVFTAIMDKGSADDVWTMNSKCEYPLFLSTDTLDGWAAQGQRDLSDVPGGPNSWRDVSWVYNVDGTIAHVEEALVNPWEKGIGVAFSMQEFSADVNKALAKAFEYEAAFLAD